MVKEIAENGQTSSIKLLDRGMSEAEVKALLTAPMSDRERAYFRAIYNTIFRAQELLKCNIEDYNKTTGELTALHTKNKYVPKTKKYIKSPPKHAMISKGTQMLFKQIIGNRKKGAIFINRKGERCTVAWFQLFINEIATRIGIQQKTHITPTGKEYHLVTIKALREAGERHMDLAGADPQVTARGSQHSALVKEKYYKKSSWEEFQQQQKKYHPDFQEES